jgi:aminotransferase
VDATASDLVITAGVNHAFTLALTTLVDPGDEVILPSPYFTNHEMSVRAAGAIGVEAPVADRGTFAITWADIEPHLTPRTRAVVLCTPSNPTGAVLAPADGARSVDELARRHLVLFCDETYLHFSYDRPHWSPASVPGWRDTVVVVGTCSKSFGMMGWRVGFALADTAVCEQMVKVQDAMIICAPVISQIAAEHAIANDWEYPLTFAGDMRRRRQLLADGIRRIPCLSWTPTGGGLFGFVRVAGCTDSVALSTELLESAHVVTIPGAAFGSAGEGCLRLSYGAAPVGDLSTALQRLAAFFGGRVSEV